MKRAVVPIVCLLVVASLAAAGVAAGDAAQPPELTQQDFDRTKFNVTVYANGSARWTFTFSRGLENESEQAAFEDYADRFNTEETSLYTDFQARADALTAKGENTTGRSMEARAYAKRAYVEENLPGQDDNVGAVEMSFRWTNAARTSGDRVVLSDIFEGGFYIASNQALVVTHGPNLVFRDAEPAPSSTSNRSSLTASDAVTWEGERAFSEQRPLVVLGSPDETPADDGTDPPTEPATDEDGSVGLGSFPWLALAAVLLLGVGAAYAYKSGALDDRGGSSAAEGGVSTPDISEEELLSDEDRVVSMLEDRGGRMKQVNIVEETGWSKSKVSMLLSDMEDDERISKLRVGRENIVSLAGEEPEAAGSPFDDEDDGE
jgi:uncharacterized membrane protein